MGRMENKLRLPHPISRPIRRRIGLVVFGMLALLMIYAICIEPYWLEVTQTTITLHRLPPAWNGLRIVQLTDFHYPVGLSSSFYRRVVNCANAQHPDIILLTGDYIAMSANDAEPCAKMLADLRAPLGVWAVLGNHDYWTDGPRMRRALELVGIHVLVNQSVQLNKDNAHLWLVGLDDAWSRISTVYPKPVQTLRGVPRAEAKIVLMHEPDYADTVAHFPVDLQLSGHSHGGQVRLPFAENLILPRYGRKYPIGLQHDGALPVFTSRGIGGVSIPFIHWPIRFRCRPEVSVLILHSK